MGKVEPVTDSEYTGIFAFEGDWTPDNLTEDWSIRPNLETLRDMYRIGFIHRRGWLSKSATRRCFPISRSDQWVNRVRRMASR